MRRLLVLLAVLGAASACGSTEHSPDAPVVRGDSRPGAAGDAADGKGDVVVEDNRADAFDMPGADAPVDAAADKGALPDSGDEVARSGGADARDARDAGRDVGAGADTAMDAGEAGRDTANGADQAADTSETGRDSGAADAQEVARNATDARDAGPFLLRSNPRKWHVTSTVTVANQNATLTKLVVVLPAPQTNLYQDIANFQQGTGTLLGIPDTDDFYVRFLPTAALPAAGTTVGYAISYDVTLYDLSVDFSKVTSIPAYDTSAPDYARYTGRRDVYVDPDNTTITAIASSLATGNPDVLTYAKAAYEYVASHYQYLNPNTGLHPLAEVLAAGGGDCGNLASIYISLLRHRGIPARHLVAIRPDGSYHVWADFLLQGYGWVPVDVTYKQADLASDYFGKVALGGNGIIMDKQVWLAMDTGGSTMELPLLQNYAWWFWTSTSSSSVTTSYALTSVAQ